MNNTYEGPYKVVYYAHNMYSNQDDYYKDKYNQIMFFEDAQRKAKGLLNSLKAYFKRVDSHIYVSTAVINNNNEIVSEFK